ncbi:MAG: heme-degrading monooxygenase HmoA [Shewanella sp.]|jgi:heme-degrading monooxygenase HmoA
MFDIENANVIDKYIEPFGVIHPMIAVIFEVQIAAGKSEEYLDIAAEIKPLLADIDGFISIERFQSLTDNSKILSLSFWRDEASIQQWRNLESHRYAQVKGRGGVFSHYRLRVAGVIRDYGMEQREEAPDDSLLAHRSTSD